MADVETGRQLRRFFIELQQGRNLARYYENRKAYVAQRRRRTEKGRTVGYLGPTAIKLLTSGVLWEIEDSIALITGSGSATVLCVVCPPI
jgi:hypothetical protein